MAEVSEKDLAELRRKISVLEQDVQHLVSHDQLTGLLIRSAFLKRVEHFLAEAKSAPLPQQCAVIEIGVRGIPRITGALGRHVGDYVISALAARLSNAIPSDCLICRLDYWSFAIFLPRITEALEALVTAKRLIELLDEPIDWVERTLTIEAAAGVALAGKLDADSIMLLHRAGVAYKAATESGGPGYAFFNPALEQAVKRRQDVQMALNEALENGYFSLAFQPYFQTSGGELAGMEALIRLNHPTLGFVSPAEFIPVAEETGMIQKIGAWVLVEACRVASHWPPHLLVSINFSPEQFLSGHLLSDVHNALELSSFPAYRMEVEITESTMLSDTEIVMSQLSALREMGCHIVMDDFGTGYSSLSYLWKFPFSKLKIDRSFIQAMETRPQVRGLLRTILDLSRNLGLKVTAEGIETVEQAELLRSQRCDFIQGYLCGKPVPESEVAAVIMTRFAASLKNMKSPEEDIPPAPMRFEF
ncbi:MAG: GGDEF domain-containing protein [Rhizobiales bacterium]|nr:GGDEF domain-containing protein [Hyphomicrobiales bacterium]